MNDFWNNFSRGFDGSSAYDASLQIILMLLGAFVLGYLLRLFISKSKYAKIETKNEELIRGVEVLRKEAAETRKLQTTTEDALKLRTVINMLKQSNDKLKHELADYKQTSSDFSGPGNGMTEVGGNGSADVAVETEPVITRTKPVSRKSAVVKKTVAKKRPTRSVSTAGKRSVRKTTTKRTKNTGTKSVTAKKTTTRRVKSDDFTRIEGIGKKIQERLRKQRIRTYRQLGDTRVGELREILRKAGSMYSMHDPGTWARQARMARDGKWEQLDKYQQGLKGGKGGKGKKKK